MSSAPHVLRTGVEAGSVRQLNCSGKSTVGSSFDASRWRDGRYVCSSAGRPPQIISFFFQGTTAPLIFSQLLLLPASCKFVQRRCCPLLSQEHFGITPDLTTMGKVIGGGLPVGAYGGRRDIMEMVAPAGPMYQAGTLSGNPLAMISGIKTLERLQRPGSYEQLDR